MNYYEHHLGDYMRDTAHLSMLEDCAYRRLLDAYYIREKPLPADLPSCYKLARAVTKQEREAVAYVLREFFTLTDDGHRQSRADAEIARFKGKSDKARASINTRWERERQRMQSEERTDNERSTNVSEAAYERTTDDIHRAPVPRHQTPVTNTPQPPSGVSPPKPTRASRKPPDAFAVTAELSAWAAVNAPGVSIDAETAKFRDHTFATPRSDWPATWRNWMRKAAENVAPVPRAPAPSQSQTPQWRLDQLCRAAEFAGPAASAEAKAALAAKRAAQAPQHTAEVIDVTARRLG